MMRLSTLLFIVLWSGSLVRGTEFEGVRSVPFFGYSNAIELTNGPVKVVLGPEGGGRVLEYSLNGKNCLFLSDDEKTWKPGEPARSSAGRFDIGPELVIPDRRVLWSSDWKGEIIDNRHARLTSPDEASTGTRLVRDFVLDAKNFQTALHTDDSQCFSEDDRMVSLEPHVCGGARHLSDTADFPESLSQQLRDI